MLKFARRLQSTSQLVKAGAPANLTKVATSKPAYYEYAISLLFIDLSIEFKSSKAVPSESTSRRTLCCSPLRQS